MGKSKCKYPDTNWRRGYIKMKISEIFFSIQAEGPHLGLPSIFIRTSLCNLKCRWCDTPYALKEEKTMSIEEIVREVKSFPCRDVVITGGEPLLWQENLISLIETLLDFSLFYSFEIETNGTIPPRKRLLELIDTWIISPKLSNSGNRPYEIGEWITEEKFGEVFLKFVVDKKEDLEEIKNFLKSTKELSWIENKNIFLMPQAVTVEEHNKKLPMIIEFAKANGFRVTSRLQILVYGQKRGV